MVLINMPDLPDRILAYSTQNLLVGMSFRPDAEAFFTCPPELFSQLQVPVPKFQHPNEFDIHRVR